MTRNIQNLALVIVSGFVIISVTLGYWQVMRAAELTADSSLNRFRMLEQEKRIARGRILDRNGVELVRTEMKAGQGRRIYAFPALSHVTGFHSVIFGNSNIEREYDDILRGEAGVDQISALIGGVTGQSSRGADVVLTVDAKLQSVAEEAMGSASGAIVAIDPRTGAILSLVSHPYYNPNTLQEDWDKLRNNPGTPLLNRATQGLYVPGSTFKTVVLAAALDAGVTNEGEIFEFNMSVDSRGRHYHTEVIDGFPFYCYNHGPTSPGKAVMNLSEVYAASCNIAFSRLGTRLGSEKLVEYARRFGFESAPPIEIGGESSRLASSPSFLRDRIGLAATAFGQGQLLATPLQMALVAAAVANEGSVPTPHLVSEVRSSWGSIPVAQSGSWKQAINPEIARAVGKLMVAGVERGWASGAKIEGIAVAGKTGTAEIQPGESPHAWFIGFAPAEDARIAVAVIKENAGPGGTEAAPIARKIIQEALDR